MKNSPGAIARSDYSSPPFLIDQVALDVRVAASDCLVHAELHLRRAPDNSSELRLDGCELELLAISIDGTPLPDDRYLLEDESLRILDPPDRFVLATTVRIQPHRNTALEGFFQSGQFLLTQCEAEGFRKITWYLDRPDVMAPFTVRLEADAGDFPVLLSNGNQVDGGRLDGGRHFAVWNDPFPKPSYLFAMVAGRLDYIEDRFTTAQGREVLLRFYAEAENMELLDFAMAALKRAMAWDEQRFGLSYDLDVYNVVATNDFNMGAMENKSLNIFNAKFVLASPETATDQDYQDIEAVIGHEYFHNWSGNRVTCRDWFQLSLKEGLTVFRDQEFTADLHSRAVKRIEDVRRLRTLQFSEDAGPMAHPVRPDSYIEINNFYTATVYEKGAEVVRMLHTLLGEAGFQAGMKLYFELHDGQAVTCDDFRRAMADANDQDLEQFERWYAQAGTPRLTASGEFLNGEYHLTLSQHTPATPGQKNKQPLHIPVRLALLDADGSELPLNPTGFELSGEGDVLELKAQSQTFVFAGLEQTPEPSLLRGFSAPVILDTGRNAQQLAFLMRHDADPFNRWDAAQQLAGDLILEKARGREPDHEPWLQAAADLMIEPGLDPALLAESLRLPDEVYLGDQMQPVRVNALHAARQQLKIALAQYCAEAVAARYDKALVLADHRLDGGDPARRNLNNLCLDLEVTRGEYSRAFWQFEQARNMTDSLAALRCLVHAAAPGAEELLQQFRKRWTDNRLVLDKWFAMQATAPGPQTLAVVSALRKDPAFSLRNPNKVRSLFGAFSRGNPTAFHAADGAGYRFLAERIVELDAINPQVAARLAAAFNGWRRQSRGRQELAQAALRRIVEHEGLSPDVYEIVSRALNKPET